METVWVEVILVNLICFYTLVKPSQKYLAVILTISFYHDIFKKIFSPPPPRDSPWLFSEILTAPPSPGHVIYERPLMGGTKLNDHGKAENAVFYHFLEGVPMKTRPRNFFQDFSDALQVENIFKPIKVINRTDSHVIWTCISRDIAHLEKHGSRLPNRPP